MTTFNKSIGGSITGSGTLATNPKTVVGQITPSGALSFLVSKSIAGRSALYGLESPLVAGGGAQQIESGGSTLAVGGLRRG